nr:odorant receptor 62 [Graphosoma rubrolineatum]
MLERIKGKKNLADLLLLLKISGLWFDFEEKTTLILQKLRYCYFLTVFIIMNVSALQDGIKSAFNGPFFLVSGGYYVTLQVVIYYIYRGKIKDIIAKFVRFHEKRKEQWQWEIFEKHSNVVWIMVWFYGVLAITFILVYYTAPLLYDLCLLLFTDDYDDRYIFSFPYPLEEIRKHDRDFIHYGMQLLSLFWSMLLECYGMGSLGLQTIICSYCCAEIHILCRAIEDGKKQKLLNNKQFVKKLITNHKDILSVIADAQVVIGPAVATQIALGALLLAAFLFLVMETKDNPSLVITYILLFSVMASLNFTFCFYGEMLQTEGNKLFEELCCLPWEEMSPKTRRDFNFILMQARKPILISYKGLLPVNFQSFQFVMNSSYSFLMLLNSTK